MNRPIHIVVSAARGAGKSWTIEKIKAALQDAGVAGRTHHADGLIEKWEGTQPQRVVIEERQYTSEKIPGEPKSHYCLECSRQWFGENTFCKDKDCPFRNKT